MVWPPIHLFWKYILRETIHFGVPTGTPGPSFILLHWWKHLYFATASLHNLEEKHSSPRNRHSYHWILLRLHWGAFQSRSTACLGHKSTWIPSTAHSQGFKLQNIHILLWLQKKNTPVFQILSSRWPLLSAHHTAIQQPTPTATPPESWLQCRPQAW